MSLNKNSTGISLLSKDKSKGNTKEDYVVALAGNPNVGKSTVFNALTGLNQHTGNWPGKTVAKAEGYYEFKDSTIKIVDLPEHTHCYQIQKKKKSQGIIYALMIQI